MKNKKIAIFTITAVMCLSMAGCGNADKDIVVNNGADSSNGEYSFDEHIVKVKNYVGKNCANLGTERESKILDSTGYGAAGRLYLNLIKEDGSFIDVTDTEELKKYCVKSQSVEPNTEIYLTFYQDNKGKEYNSVIEAQSIEEIDLYITLIDGDNSSVETKTNKSEIAAESTSETLTTSITAAAVTEKEETTLAGSNGIHPEFKEAMDSYEAFYDEYCDIMKKYMENPTDLTILSQYSECLEKAEEFDEKIDDIDEDSLTPEEDAYYLEVTGRVLAKMLEIYQ